METKREKIEKKFQKLVLRKNNFHGLFAARSKKNLLFGMFGKGLDRKLSRVRLLRRRTNLFLENVRKFCFEHQFQNLQKLSFYPDFCYFIS